MFLPPTKPSLGRKRKQCGYLGYSIGKEWERKSPEGTFLLDSHSATWWKSGFSFFFIQNVFSRLGMHMSLSPCHDGAIILGVRPTQTITTSYDKAPIRGT